MDLDRFSWNLFMRFITRRRGTLVGTDSSGNRYYEDKKVYDRRKRRWVLFKGSPEASRVPPAWHAWLHYVIDEVPGPGDEEAPYPWAKPHRPNQTGTGATYLPPGHTLMGGQRAKGTGDYEPWTPG